MAEKMNVYEVSPDLISRCKAFRMAKSTGAICALLLKVDRKKELIVLEEDFEDITIEDLVQEIPHQQPRYIVMSFPLTHSDGRVSYPLIFIFISPEGCSPELQMLYAGSKQGTVDTLQMTKIMEFRELEECTEEAIKAKLKGITR